MRHVKAGIVASMLVALGAAGPAPAAERGYAVAGFDRVRSAGPFDVEVRVGGPVSVRAYGAQPAIDRLEIRSEGGILAIRARDGGWRRDREGRVVVRVTVPSLTGVTLLGSGDMTVGRARAPAFSAILSGSGNLSIGAVDAQEVTLRIAGSGDIGVAGRARTARASISGSGDIAAGDLAVGDADISVAGSGNVAMRASGTARVSVAGSGDVTIAGRARCTIAKTGSGEVRCGG